MYPIRTVSKLTGLSLDTLRAWERRYGAVRPSRTDRGRAYSEADVHRLMLLRDAVGRGYAIGQVATMADEALRDLLSSGPFALPAPEPAAPAAPRAAEVDLQPILDAVVRFDAAAVDRELTRYAALLPPRDLVFGLVVPLLQRVGDGWQAGDLAIAHEHLTSGALRSLLGTLVRVHSRPGPRPSLIFATPGGERHEFGILIAAMLAVGAGLGCVYLGPDLPVSEIAAAARSSSARIAVLGVTGAGEGAAPVPGLESLVESLPPGVEVWVGGYKSEELGRDLRQLRVRVFESLDEYERALSAIAPRP